jgi:lysophospholipase L1-like esterase
MSLTITNYNQISTISSTNILTGNITATNLTVSSITNGSLTVTSNVIIPKINRLIGTDSTGSISSRGLQQQGIYIPAGWGSIWQSKLSSASSSLARIAVVGDSISQGYDASNFLTNSYVSLVKANLQGLYGSGGSGFRSVVNTAFTGGYTSSSTMSTKSSNWTSTQTQGGPCNYGIFTQTNGSTITYANVEGTTIDVYYALSNIGGRFTVSIDGAAATTINTSAASSSTATFSFTGLSTSLHSVLINAATTGSLAVLIFGVRGYNSSGVVVDNYSVSGQSTVTFLNSDNTYLSPIDWSGGVYTPCDLFILALCVNDAANNTAIDTYIANVITIIKRIREYTSYAGLGSVDILMFVPHIGKWDPTNNKFYDYCLRLEALSNAMNIAVVTMTPIYRCSWAYANTFSIWSDGHTGTGAAGTDQVHPSNIGHGIYSNVLIPILNSLPSF